MTVVSNKNAKKGLAARLRQRAGELDAAERQERAQAAALSGVMSLAYGVFLAGRHRARCELDFRAAVQHHKDSIGFKGRFDKTSDEYAIMLLATDPVYRRLEIARRLEKYVKALLSEEWGNADLTINDADFWSVSARMQQVDAEEFLRDFHEENQAVASGIREAHLDGEGELTLRRAEANAEAAAELLAEVGINP